MKIQTILGKVLDVQHHQFSFYKVDKVMTNKCKNCQNDGHGRSNVYQCKRLLGCQEAFHLLWTVCGKKSREARQPKSKSKNVSMSC